MLLKSIVTFGLNALVHRKIHAANDLSRG